MSDAAQSSAPQRTLLIVDDEPSVCVALEYFLSSAGYRVFTAGSGAASVALAERETIDGALVDVHMPVMNGLDTCERLRASTNRTGRSLRVWFMTGAFTSALEKRCTEMGGICLFSKPFDLPALSARLEEGFAAAPLTVALAAPEVPRNETGLRVVA